MELRKVRILALIEYIIAIFIVLDCRSVYTVSINSSMPIQEMVITFSMLLLVIKLISNKKVLLKRQVFLVLFLMIFFMLFFGINVINTSSKTDYLIRFPLFVCLLLLSNSKNEQNDFMTRLLLKYSNVVVILALISLFFWIFGSILDVIRPTGTFSYYWGKERTAASFFGIYFETNKSWFLFTELYRNNGIFTEGPMHSLNLSIALAVNMFIDKKIMDKPFCIKNIILVLTILSSISVTGIGCIALIYIIKNLFSYEIKHRGRNLSIALVMIIMVCVFLPILLSLKVDTISYLLRIDDYIVGFKAWIDNFLVGGGYGIRNYIDYLQSWRSNQTGYSNSLFWILSQGGILFFAIYLVPTISCVIINHNKYTYNENLFILVIWYLIISTSFAYQMILILIVTRWLWKSNFSGYVVQNGLNSDNDKIIRRSAL